MNDICCCHSIEGAVFRVQHPYLIKNKQEMTKNCLKNQNKMSKKFESDFLLQ